MSRNEGVWLSNGFSLDILAVFPLYSHFDCLYCRIIYRQVKDRPSAKELLSFVDGHLILCSSFLMIGCIVQIVLIFPLIIKTLSVAIVCRFYSIQNLHSFEKEIGKIFNDYGEDMPSLGNISLRLFLFCGFYNLTCHFFNGHYPK